MAEQLAKAFKKNVKGIMAVWQKEDIQWNTNTFCTRCVVCIYMLKTVKYQRGYVSRVVLHHRISMAAEFHSALEGTGCC